MPVVNKNTMSMALSPNRKSINEVESGAFSGWRWPGNADHILTQLCRWCEQSEITGTTQRAVGLTKAQERDASRLSMVSVKYIYRPGSIIEEREGILPWTSHASPNHFIGGGEVSPCITGANVHCNDVVGSHLDTFVHSSFRPYLLKKMVSAMG